jgi:MFS family permease
MPRQTPVSSVSIPPSALPIALLILGLMLPVTALVPVLQEVTGERYPGLTSFQKHLFMSVNMIGAFLFAPLAGLLSDRLGRRKVLIVVAFGINGLALLLMRAEWSYPVYLALRFMEGCAHITSLSLLLTLAIDVSRSSDRRGTVMGMTGAALTLGVAVGAPLGGFVGQHAPLSVFLWGGALMIVLGVVALFVLRELEGRDQPAPLRLLLQTVRQKKLLWVPYSFTFIDRLTVGFIISTMTLYLRNELGATPREIGMIMAFFLLPFSLLTYPSGRLSRRFDKLKMMIAGSLLYGLLLIAMAHVPLEAVRWMMLGGGVAAALMFAPSLVLVGDTAGSGDRATCMAGFNTAGSLGFLLGPLFGGTAVTLLAAMDLPPYQGAFLLAGGLEILCAIACWLLLPKIRRAMAAGPAPA